MLQDDSSGCVTKTRAERNEHTDPPAPAARQQVWPEVGPLPHSAEPSTVPSSDPVEAALASALDRAAAAGRFDIVMLLVVELRARRLAREGVGVPETRGR